MYRFARIISVAVAAGICWLFTRWLGDRGAIGAWAILAAIACGIAAFLLHTSTQEQITWKNRVGGFVLQWGYSIARGKLIGITIFSWLIWTLGGAVMIWDLSRRASGHAGILGSIDSSLLSDRVRGIILLIEWIFDGLAVLIVLTVLARPYQSPNVIRARLQLLAALIAMLGGSLLLWNWGWPSLAIIVAGPPILICGAYGLFIMLVMIFGRNIRWN